MCGKLLSHYNRLKHLPNFIMLTLNVASNELELLNRLKLVSL